MSEMTAKLTTSESSDSLLPNELQYIPVPFIGLIGLNATNNAIHALIWNAFTVNRQSDRPPLYFKLFGDKYSFMSSKQKVLIVMMLCYDMIWMYTYCRSRPMNGIFLKGFWRLFGFKSICLKYRRFVCSSMTSIGMTWTGMRKEQNVSQKSNTWGVLCSGRIRESL